MWVLEIKPSPLKEQPVCLTAETSLQPSTTSFLFNIYLLSFIQCVIKTKSIPNYFVLLEKKGSQVDYKVYYPSNIISFINCPELSLWSTYFSFQGTSLCHHAWQSMSFDGTRQSNVSYNYNVITHITTDVALETKPTCLRIYPGVVDRSACQELAREQ